MKNNKNAKITSQNIGGREYMCVKSFYSNEDLAKAFNKNK